MEQILEKIPGGRKDEITEKKVIFYEEFDMPEIDSELSWINPPKDFALENGFSCLVVKPSKGSEFWKTSSKKYSYDSGHFLNVEISGDFIITSKIKMRPCHRYDQSGIMVRVSETCWIKAGYEQMDEDEGGITVTVANGKYSDWSLSGKADCKDFTLRISREGNNYTIEYLDLNSHWVTVRMAHLENDYIGNSVKCGVFAESPEENGMSVSFDYLRITGCGDSNN